MRALERLSPSAARLAMESVSIMRAVSGWENTNIARTSVLLKPSSPPKTRVPMASLLPTCPGGVGKIVNILKVV